MIPRRSALCALAASLVLAATVTACTAAPPADTASTPAATSTADAEAPVISEDVFAERDRFIDAQQQPRDGSDLVAKTPEQQAFVAAQRAHVEERGGTWSSDAETLTLAVALDACETSILNAHTVSTDTVASHIGTSPLFAAYEPDSPSVRGLASIMVFGVGYLCPDDAPQWEAGYAALYGS